MQGGRSTDTDSVTDTGCTFPITATAVAEGIAGEVKSLTEDLDIIDDSGKSLAILGTIKMFIDNRVLGGRKLVEAAVIQGDDHISPIIEKVGISSWQLPVSNNK